MTSTFMSKYLPGGIGGSSGRADYNKGGNLYGQNYQVPPVEDPSYIDQQMNLPGDLWQYLKNNLYHQRQ